MLVKSSILKNLTCEDITLGEYSKFDPNVKALQELLDSFSPVNSYSLSILITKHLDRNVFVVKLICIHHPEFTKLIADVRKLTDLFMLQLSFNTFHCVQFRAFARMICHFMYLFI